MASIVGSKLVQCILYKMQDSCMVNFLETLTGHCFKASIGKTAESYLEGVMKFVMSQSGCVKLFNILY